MLKQKTQSLTEFEVKTTLPGRAQLKYHDLNFKQNRPVTGRRHILIIEKCILHLKR